MPGIGRHIVAGCIPIFILMFYPQNFQLYLYPALAFLVGNIVPDLLFVPYVCLKEKTFTPKEMINTKTWKKLCGYDEKTMLVLSTIIMVLWFNNITFSFFLGVLTHNIMDMFIQEKTWLW